MSASIDDLNACLVKFNEIFSQIASDQKNNALKLKKRADGITKQQASVKATVSKANMFLDRANKRLVAADSRYEKADKIASFLENVADKDRKRMDKLTRRVKFIKSDIEAGKRTLKQDGERLKIKEAQVNDKRQALDRAYAEIKQKAAKAGIVI